MPVCLPPDLVGKLSCLVRSYDRAFKLCTFYFSSKSSLSKVDKRYQSAYDLEATPKIRETRNRSTSMQNLDEEDRRNESKVKPSAIVNLTLQTFKTSSIAAKRPVRHFGVFDELPDAISVTKLSGSATAQHEPGLHTG